MKKRIIFAGVSITLGLIIVLCVALLFAKYKMNLGEQSEITSQNFYFSSNFLKSDEEPPVYEIYGNTVTFEVRNYIDSLRVNKTKIKYTVTADGVTLKKAGETENYTGGELTLAGGAKNFDSITLTYNFPNGEDQKEIIVTATGTGDYTQTIKAKFVLIKPYNLRYEIKDKENRDYAELYIYTGNTKQDVTLKWDKANLVIDETNDYVFGKVQNQVSPEKSYVEINNIDADTTVKIVFFKKDITKNYKQSLTESGGTIDMPTTGSS